MEKKKVVSSRTEKAKELKFGKKIPITYIKILLDESGSMNSCLDQTIEGFNNYIETLVDDKDNNYRLTLTKFGGNRSEILFRNKSPNTATKLSSSNYNPNGLTPLYDAIGNTINASKSNGRTLFVILTDGEENASQEYNRNAINKLIKKQEANGWTFIYLGADQDAWAHSQHLGLSRGNTLSFCSLDTGKTYGKLAKATVGFTQSKGQTKKFFKEHWK